nr:MAG TPA: hypothetical protein [Caudoviricetes sp.]
MKSTELCKTCAEYSIYSKCEYKKTRKLQKIFERKYKASRRK